MAIQWPFNFTRYYTGVVDPSVEHFVSSHPDSRSLPGYRCIYIVNAPFSFVGFVAAVAQIYVIPSGRGARRGLRTFPFVLQRS